MSPIGVQHTGIILIVSSLCFCILFRKIGRFLDTYALGYFFFTDFVSGDFPWSNHVAMLTVMYCLDILSTGQEHLLGRFQSWQLQIISQTLIRQKLTQFSQKPVKGKAAQFATEICIA